MVPLSSDDHSRVKLKEIAGEEGSNYINACFLNVSAECLRYVVLFGRSSHGLLFLHRATIVRMRTLRLKVSACNICTCIMSKTILKLMFVCLFALVF